MKTAILDIETFTLYADTARLLCCSWMKYDGDGKIRTIRADKQAGWKEKKSDLNLKATCEAVVEELHEYDIFVAHNGIFFDRSMITSWALKYDLSMFLGIKETKTAIQWDHWKQAAYDWNVSSMDYIVEHCEVDVSALGQAYGKMRKLVKDINERGSSF